MLSTSGNVNNGANAPIAVNQVGSGRADLISGEPGILQMILSVSITGCRFSRNGSPQTMESRSVPDLQTLVASATLGKVQEPGDLSRIACLIYMLPPGLEPGLVQLAADKLTKVTMRDSASLASVNLRMMVAKVRVMNGELWAIVAQEHGIMEEQDMLTLQMIVVEGSAGECVMRGEHCGMVANRFRIRHMYATLRLQMMAAKGPASKSVQQGEHCAIVAKRYGIEHSLAILDIEMVAVNNWAKLRVEQGEDWATVANKYGITHAQALNHLHRLALRVS